MSEPAFDRVLATLVDRGVDFVLIGGLALGSWGVVRATKDIDIVADPDPENLRRLAEVAVEIGGHVQGKDSFASTPFSILALLSGGERVLIESTLGSLDVVRGLDGVPSYAELASRAVEAELLGVRVTVCSRKDLRAMKRSAGRHRDLADLEDLDAAEGEG
ncbi:MAG: nucleotidyltransferase [Actinomycetota bacterium]|nr:nucleotidyltransferase [Actinomycetota bacterium]